MSPSLAAHARAESPPGRQEGLTRAAAECGRLQPRHQQPVLQALLRGGGVAARHQPLHPVLPLHGRLKGRSPLAPAKAWRAQARGAREWYEGGAVRSNWRAGRVWRRAGGCGSQSAGRRVCTSRWLGWQPLAQDATGAARMAVSALRSPESALAALRRRKSAAPLQPPPPHPLLVLLPSPPSVGLRAVLLAQLAPLWAKLLLHEPGGVASPADAQQGTPALQPSSTAPQFTVASSRLQMKAVACWATASNTAPSAAMRAGSSGTAGACAEPARSARPQEALPPASPVAALRGELPPRSMGRPNDRHAIAWPRCTQAAVCRACRRCWCGLGSKL